MGSRGAAAIPPKGSHLGRLGRRELGLLSLQPGHRLSAAVRGAAARPGVRLQQLVSQPPSRPAAHLSPLWLP